MWSCPPDDRRLHALDVPAPALSAAERPVGRHSRHPIGCRRTRSSRCSDGRQAFLSQLANMGTMMWPEGGNTLRLNPFAKRDNEHPGPHSLPRSLARGHALRAAEARRAHLSGSRESSVRGCVRDAPGLSHRSNTMPIYDSRCKSCGSVFEELLLGSTDEINPICPKCGTEGSERLIGAPSVLGSSTDGGGCSAPPGEGFT